MLDYMPLYKYTVYSCYGKENNRMNQIKGIRKCGYCQGICHEGSYRTNYKKRNKYFCSRNCMIDYDYSGVLRKYSMVEYIDVITK